MPYILLSARFLSKNQSESRRHIDIFSTVTPVLPVIRDLNQCSKKQKHRTMLKILMKNKLWILFIFTIIFFLSHFHINRRRLKRENILKNEVILKRLEIKSGKLGSDGKAVHFSPVKKEIQTLQKEIIAKFTIDHVLSDRIGLHRKIGEHRHPQCLTKNYSNIFQKPKKASIIFNVFNEAWSTLLRSVFSILHTAPLNLVEEIILIDDNSDFSFLGERLDQKIEEIEQKEVLFIF